VVSVIGVELELVLEGQLAAFELFVESEISVSELLVVAP
jgi:hypothetical protein